MARYFFALTNGDSISDDVGEEFDLVEEAKGHVLRVARELCRNRPWAVDLGRYISVTDPKALAGPLRASSHRIRPAEALVLRSVREHLKSAAPIDDRSPIDTHVVRVEVQPEQLVIHLAWAKTPDRQRANGNNILNVRWRKSCRGPNTGARRPV